MGEKVIKDLTQQGHQIQSWPTGLPPNLNSNMEEMDGLKHLGWVGAEYSQWLQPGQLRQKSPESKNIPIASESHLFSE